MAKGKCGFCGEKFDNVFEVVDHLDDEFNPRLIASEKVRLPIGDLLYEVYKEGNEKLKELAEELFSALYIADKRPEQFEHILTNHSNSLSKIVYYIVTQDSWELAFPLVKVSANRE